ncbi:hypothetical protein D3C77_285370 [compost metagenome]
MTTSTLFQLQAGSHPLQGEPHTQIYSCLQWKGRNLEIMPQAFEQRICVMYNDFLDERLIIALEHAYVRGMISPVKVFALHDNDFRLFLDKSVNSDTVSTMQKLWEDFTSHDATRRYSVTFASEHELLTGRSDYPFWLRASGIIQTYSLGFASYEFRDLDPFDPEEYSPDEVWSFLSGPDNC